MRSKLGLFLVLTFAAFAFSQETYSTWSSYKTISVNTTSAGANVANAVTSFPVLVRLTSANADVFSQSAAGGADIRFTDSTGTTRLIHEKERWNVAGQQAEFWVMVPSVAGNAVTNFRMYWGKSSAVDSSSPAKTFSRGNGFLGVWHMGNPTGAPETSPRPNAVNPGTNDAIPSVNEVVGFAPGYTVTAGMIGGADTLVGGSTGTGGGAVTPGAYFDLGAISDTGYANLASGFTISMWARIASVANPTTSAYTRLVEISNGFNANSLTLDRSNNTTALRYELNSNGTGQTSTAANFWKADDIYHHIVLTVSNVNVNAGKTVHMYLDGVASTATTTLTAALTNMQRTAGRLGCGTPAEDRESLTGALDEVELSNVDRSADWVNLSYQTQKTGSTAVTLGASLSTASAPGAPTSVVAAGGNAQASLAWTAPASNGGATITAYTATSVLDTSKHCSTTGGTSCTVTGLANGTAYTFTVTATNIAGTSAASVASNTVTPAAPIGVPSVPKTVTGTAGNGQVTVNWIVPDSTGGSAITGYTVTSNPDGKTCSTTVALTCNVTALTNGAAYSFTVTATNGFGTSAPSASSSLLTPVGVPGAPSNVIATAGVKQASISWATPTSNGGAAITGYTATAVQDTSKHCTSATLSCNVTGLTNGASYTFTVTATNSVGAGAASAASTSITLPTVPGAPVVTTVVGASGQVTVTWTAPSSTGGTAITSYTATAVQDTSKHCTLTVLTGTLSCAVTGLTNTTAYTFNVTATNAAGTGAASANSISVTGISSFARDVNLHLSLNSVSLNLPEITGTATVSIMDLWGRTVWSKTVGVGVHQVSWGRGSASGINPGLYILRLTMQDANHKPQVAAQAKIVVTP